MKKTIFLITIVALVALAGAAWAHGGNWSNRSFGFGPSAGCNMGYYNSEEPGYGPGYGPRAHFRNSDGYRYNRNVNVPQEIQNKWNEMRRARLEMQLELSQPQINREKARSLHEKILGLRQEVSRWMFNQRLDATTPQSN